MPWSMDNEREAPVPPDAVYRCYVDPSTWGNWGHNTRWARIDGPFVEGATVEVKAGYDRVWPVLIRRLVPGRSVECVVRPPGVVIVSTYDVQPAPTGARLHHTIEISGPLELPYLLLKPLYSRLLAKETRRLVELVQSRST